MSSGGAASRSENTVELDRMQVEMTHAELDAFVRERFRNQTSPSVRVAPITECSKGTMYYTCPLISYNGITIDVPTLQDMGSQFGALLRDQTTTDPARAIVKSIDLPFIFFSDKIPVYQKSLLSNATSGNHHLTVAASTPSLQKAFTMFTVGMISLFGSVVLTMNSGISIGW